jgi:hypothetical protein
MDERKQVFEALLAVWRASESALIGEFGRDIAAEEAEADRVMENWRRRYREAHSRGDGAALPSM